MGSGELRVSKECSRLNKESTVGSEKRGGESPR